ncbi:hypothetical protein [Flavobacterium algoritolerans]|uniref:Outer membrane protein beta-barrel domain-containing protein n=1 Tax=Flavobacterium algoritolerans TaxID=3041254 RepID=A0ABT6V9I6_9FLAO|nr:hypothetical protein [Flavobacterium algoritolerans]MDI5894891.1 hypothetical protein [Flavobacterium algoritolerans]
MKKIFVLLTTLLLLVGQFIYAQNKTENTILSKDKKPFYLETGINASLPVHIQMYRSHRLALGINARAGKIISRKLELGIRFDYDYRFIKKGSRILTPESTLTERALHSNFSLFSIKPNVQFNLNSNYFLGVETGLGYALSDEDSKIGLGFVSEYASDQQFGLCSGLYFGKSFDIGSNKDKISLSLNFTQFLALGHAENSLGLRINYLFLK